VAGEEVAGQERVFADAAIQKLQAIVNDNLFIEDVLKGNYSRARFETERFGVFKDPIKNEEIVEVIKTGKEQVSPADNEIDLKVKLADDLGDDILGSTPPRALEFRTNVNFFKRWFNENPKDSLSLAAHWMHEWLHVTGFRHVKVNRKPDYNDAVYKIGRYVVAAGKRLASTEGIAPVEVEAMGAGYLEFYNENNNIDEGQQFIDEDI
jgi:hypothetical protein